MDPVMNKPSFHVTVTDVARLRKLVIIWLLIALAGMTTHADEITPVAAACLTEIIE